MALVTRALLALALALAAAPVHAAMPEALAWEKLAETTAKREKLSPAAAEQTVTMVRAAIDDAVNSASPLGPGDSSDVAAAVAAHRVLVKMLPTHKARFDARLQALSKRLTAEETVIEAAASAGRTAADAVLEAEWRYRKTPAVPTRLPKLVKPDAPAKRAIESIPMRAGAD